MAIAFKGIKYSTRDLKEFSDICYLLVQLGFKQGPDVHVDEALAAISNGTYAEVAVDAAGNVMVHDLRTVSVSLPAAMDFNEFAHRASYVSYMVGYRKAPVDTIDEQPVQQEPEHSIAAGDMVLTNSGQYFIAFPAQNGEMHFTEVPEKYPEGTVTGAHAFDLFYGGIATVYGRENEYGIKRQYKWGEKRETVVTMDDLKAAYAAAYGLKDVDDVVLWDETQEDEE